jgi:hypothetical protein
MSLVANKLTDEGSKQSASRYTVQVKQVQSLARCGEQIRMNRLVLSIAS